MAAQLRTGWLSLTVWPVAMAGLVIAIAAGVTELYPSAESREVYAATMGASPATMAFNGRWHDLTTLGGITTYEVGFLGLLLFPPIAVHLAISRTRGEEDSGRAELLTAGRVARLALLTGALVTMTLVAALFGVLVAVGLTVVGLPITGSCWYAAALALFFCWFGVLGLLVGQLGRTSRTAMGLGLGIALGMFLIRAVVDGRELKLAWATPMGWLPEVRPFSAAPVVWPLVGFAVSGVALIVVAALIALRRDLGAGVLTPRPGPATGSAVLGHPVGLAWRLTRGAALGWAVGLAAWGGAIGTLTAEMADLVRTNPGMAMLLGDGRPEDIVTALATIIIALGGGALGLQALGVLQSEETQGRLGLVLATPIGRVRWWVSWWLVVSIEVAVAVGVGAVGLGVSTRLVTEGGAVSAAVLAAASYLPAVLALIAVAGFAAMVMRGGIVVGWVLLAWAAIVALLGDTLRLPEWARGLSPLHHTGRVPIENADGVALMVGVVAGLAAFALATAIGRARDLRAG